MNPFQFYRPTHVQHALELGSAPGAQFLGGGTNLVDLMKGGAAQPRRIIDITGLPYTRVERLADGGMRIGALVRNSDAANHPLVREYYPLLTQAFVSGASPQLRNMATVGGNLLQRTRCSYFTDTSFSMCNKRVPGSGCAARGGYNRMHAILGASDACVATNPSDMSVALTALDAVVRVQNLSGFRSIPMATFLRLPGQTPERDTELKPGELIVGVDLPANAFASHSIYLKVRDRASYAFALVSVAVALDLKGARVRDCRVVLGGVAPKPWRAVDSEATLRNSELDEMVIGGAAQASTSGAQPLTYNAFKVELAQRAVGRALRRAARI
jgi:xanthine dehydrogenase YagS FAD-binding subunit